MRRPKYAPDTRARDKAYKHQSRSDTKYHNPSRRQRREEIREYGRKMGREIERLSRDQSGISYGKVGLVALLTGAFVGGTTLYLMNESKEAVVKGIKVVRDDGFNINNDSQPIQSLPNQTDGTNLTEYNTTQTPAQNITEPQIENEIPDTYTSDIGCLELKTNLTVLEVGDILEDKESIKVISDFYLDNEDYEYEDLSYILETSDGTFKKSGQILPPKEVSNHVEPGDKIGQYEVPCDSKIGFIYEITDLPVHDEFFSRHRLDERLEVEGDPIRETHDVKNWGSYEIPKTTNEGYENISVEFSESLGMNQSYIGNHIKGSGILKSKSYDPETGDAKLGVEKERISTKGKLDI